VLGCIEDTHQFDEESNSCISKPISNSKILKRLWVPLLLGFFYLILFCSLIAHLVFRNRDKKQ